MGCTSGFGTIFFSTMGLGTGGVTGIGFGLGGTTTGFGLGAGGVMICFKLRLIFFSFPWGGGTLRSSKLFTKSSKMSKCNSNESNNPFSVLDLMILSLV